MNLQDKLELLEKQFDLTKQTAKLFDWATLIGCKFHIKYHDGFFIHVHTRNNNVHCFYNKESALEFMKRQEILRRKFKNINQTNNVKLKSFRG